MVQDQGLAGFILFGSWARSLQDGNFSLVGWCVCIILTFLCLFTCINFSKVEKILYPIN